MSAREEKARLFVALELPERARDALVDWRSGAVRGVRGLRPIAAADLHATLCFLGWRELAEIGAISAACECLSAEPAVQLRLGAATWLPRRRPRVLAVGLDDVTGGLKTVQASVAFALVKGGWYEPERRPFFGHVTVARVGQSGRPRGRELPLPPPLELCGSAITLYRSRLSRTGASYEPLERFELC